MNIETFPVGSYGVNCAVLWNDPTRAWIIDPGADVPDILAVLNRNRLTGSVIVLTHGHFDHISGLNALTQALPEATVYLHAADEPFAFHPANAMPAYGYPQTARPAALNTGLGDGDTLEAGGITARFLHTPGHTPGSWCILFDEAKLMFSGDTLFADSIGRTDFPGGSWRQMGESLERLKALPTDYRVICGHGPETTLFREKRCNPYMNGEESL
ncbi:MAG: MBL fold metallo-hydrolase [Kiritimatiellae bacterium]|nr:MBL fold metallo-hydrolase [Kiritimatiellia bacterium]